MQNNLNEIISAIFRAAMGETETKPSEEISALFDRLSIAAQTGDTDFFRQLVEAEKQKGRKNTEPTLLMAATLEGKADIVRALIGAGADVNAMSQPDSKVISLFRGDGISRTALHFAVEEGQKDAIALLLEAGADPDIRDSLGNSALDVVMQKGLTDIATMFQSSERSRNRSF